MKSTEINTAQRVARYWAASLAGLALLTALPSGYGQTTTLLTDHFTYLPGEDIVVSFNGGPGAPLDWIGVYPPDVEPGPVPSTIWRYTDGTQTGNTGFTEGQVTFAGGLNSAGDWVAYFLLNNGYTKVATNAFRVVDPLQTYIRLAKRVYKPGESISVAFTNGPGNAKDWVALYPESRLPAPGSSSLLWAYVDGTQTGSTGQTEGVIQFPAGLPDPGQYLVYLLQDGGYTSVTSEPFEIRADVTTPRVLSLRPVNGSSNVPPQIEFFASITNGTSKVVASSVELLIDNAKAAHQYTEQDGLVTITYKNPSLLTAGSTHTYTLRFLDNAVPANSVTNEGTFTIIQYVDLQLPAPLYAENFDTTDEGKLPAGWRSESYSVVDDENFDLQNLNSKSYADWVVVNRSRFTNTFLSYDTLEETDDYKRVLSVNPANVVNGEPVTDLAQGNFIFADSGYRDGGSQYLVLHTPDFDLSGKTNIYVSYHSLWEQNQDSIGAVEYSIDQGATWSPIVYMLVVSDVLTNDTGAVDAVATFTTPYGDLALYNDPISGEQKGGTYSAYIAAPVSEALAPYISARVEDDPVASKRVEFFPLPKADNQPKVRLRFAHAGTDSWYFGIDNFALYSIGQAATPVSLSISKSGNELLISWPAGTSGFNLESTDSLTAPSWTPVEGVSGNSITVPIGPAQKFYRLKK